MADAVSTQVILNGSRNLVVKLTNTSDGTGEAAVKKVDASDQGASFLTIEKIHYSVAGMVARLLWDATTDVTIVDLQGDGCLNACDFGGLPNNAGAGVTGDILLTTVGHTAGDSYSIILEMKKS
jgi:hypothetical protein